MAPSGVDRRMSRGAKRGIHRAFTIVYNKGRCQEFNLILYIVVSRIPALFELQISHLFTAETEIMQSGLPPGTQPATL